MTKSRWRTGYPATWYINIACDGLQEAEGATVLSAVGRLVLCAGALEYACALGAGIESGQFANVIGRYPCDFLGPLGSVLLDLAGNQLESRGCRVSVVIVFSP